MFSTKYLFWKDTVVYSLEVLVLFVAGLHEEISFDSVHSAEHKSYCGVL